MNTSHIPTHRPLQAQRHSPTVVVDDPIERAMHELARAGISFEIISEDGDWERAA